MSNFNCGLVAYNGVELIGSSPEKWVWSDYHWTVRIRAMLPDVNLFREWRGRLLVPRKKLLVADRNTVVLETAEGSVCPSVRPHSAQILPHPIPQQDGYSLEYTLLVNFPLPAV